MFVQQSFAKLASLASVLHISGPVEHLPVPDRTWLHNHLTPRHMLEMSQDDKMSLLFCSWRRLQLIASTQLAGAVLKSVHLLSMDVRMLQLLFLELI
jgi:hypothetical protein